MALVAGPSGRPSPRITLDWQVLVPRLIHSTKVLIIEAMLWIERPLSATELEKIARGTIAISTFTYHLDHLVEAEALEVITKLKARRSQGAKKEKFYFLREEHGWASSVAQSEDLVDPLLNTALAIVATVLSIGGPAAGIM